MLAAIVVFSFLSASAAPPTAPVKSDVSDMAKAADAFYAAYQKLPAAGGIPDAKARKKISPFMSPALEKLLTDAAAAEALYAKRTKNQVPPLVEGDPFTSNFEGATGFKVGDCAGDAKRGHCAIALTYKEKKSKPVTWTDTAELVSTGGNWSLGDITYGATWDFGNKGKLTDLLKDTILEAQKPVDAD